jgi:hypothetical protein
MGQPRSNTGTTTATASDSGKAQSLEEWCAYRWKNGVQVPELPPLERLLVRTHNNLYEIIIVDPVRAEVMVRGGRYFPEFTRAVVCGSSVGSGFLKLHGIYLGFCLELHSRQLPVVTSPVREITRTEDRGFGEREQSI